MPDVRRADHRDVGDIARLVLHSFHQEYAERFPSYKASKVIGYLAWHVENGAVFIVRANDSVVGVMAVAPVEPWWTDHKEVRDGLLYVHPDHRGRVAFALVKAAKQYARDMGLPLVCGVQSGGDVERKDRFFAKNGFTRVGGVYVMEGA